MDASIVASELQTHKIRQGPIYKRTKFLQEWQQRWAVLTMNFFFVFSNRALTQVVDYIDLRDVLSYKSYLRKDDDMIPAGWKVTTQDEIYYFCARNCNEKWSWIVSLQRLMDFKYTGKSPYNNMEWISTRGFMSQLQFQKGKFDDRVDDIPKEPKFEPKPEKKETKTQEKDIQKLKKQLEEEKKRIAAKEQQILRKERDLEEMFILQLNKLKKAEEELKSIQAEVELKSRQAERAIAQARQRPKQIIVETKVEVIEKIIEKPVEVIVEKPIEIVQKAVEVVAEKKVEVVVEKTVEAVVQKPIQIQKKLELQKQPSVKKEQQESTSTTTIKNSVAGQKVSEMKKLYESKMDVSKYPQQPTLKSVVSQKSKEQNKSKDDFLHLCRDKVILNLFEEFHSKSYTYGGLRAIIQFLIRVCSERSLGYQAYFIREAKAHQNRFVFAEVFLELITNNKDYTTGKSLSKLVELLIFQAPGIFKLNHFDIIKRKMADLFLNATDQNDLAAILKTMYVVHKVKKYEKDTKIHQKLQFIETLKSEQAKNWARKLVEEI